jgi:hypothetical protein
MLLFHNVFNSVFFHLISWALSEEFVKIILKKRAWTIIVQFTNLDDFRPSY